jgi:hypothetical protein
MSLNAIKVQNLKPKKSDYRVADGGGLYILVRSNGSKLWRYDYRLTNSLTARVARRTFSIGEFSPDGDGANLFTLAQAREEHEKARDAVASGQHPVSPTQRGAAAAQAKAELGDITFGTLADQWLAARKVGHSPKTYARDLRSATYLKTGYRGGKGVGDVGVDQLETAHLTCRAWPRSSTSRPASAWSRRRARSWPSPSARASSSTHPSPK